MIFPVRGATAVASANVVIAREFTSLALRGLITCRRQEEIRIKYIAHVVIK